MIRHMLVDLIILQLMYETNQILFKWLKEKYHKLLCYDTILTKKPGDQYFVKNF